jgi:hypothetical protein
MRLLAAWFALIKLFAMLRIRGVIFLHPVSFDPRQPFGIDDAPRRQQFSAPQARQL